MLPEKTRRTRVEYEQEHRQGGDVESNLIAKLSPQIEMLANDRF